MAVETAPYHRVTRRWFLGAIAGIVGTTATVGLINEIASSGQEQPKAIPNSVSDTFNRPNQKPGFIIEEFSTATPEPSKTATPIVEVTASPTTAPTIAPTKEPTVSPTEVPKRPNWTEEQIIKAQQEAAENGSPLLLDTWSEKGAKAVEARTPGQTDALAFNGFKEGDTFDSPEAGKVEYLTVEVLRGNFKFRSVVIRTKSDILALWIGFNDKILVKEGQEFELNQPLVELSGDFLPSDLRMMKYGQPYKSQICLAVNRTDGNIYLKNILTDNGLPVQLASKG